MQSLASHTPGSVVTAFATPHVAFLMALQPEHQRYQAKVIESIQEGWSGQIDHWDQT